MLATQTPAAGTDRAEALLGALDLHCAVSETDAAGTIVAVNDRFCAISGYSRARLVGAAHSIVASGVHPPAFFADMWRTLASGAPWRGELCNRARGGCVYWLDAVITPRRALDGTLIGYVMAASDVTAHHRAAAQLAAVESRQREAAELSRVGAWSYLRGADGPIWDDVTRAIVDAPPGYAPKLETQLSFFPPAARAALSAAFDRCLADGAPYDLQLPMDTLADRRIHVRVVGRPERGADGSVSRVVGVLQDVTDARDRELAGERLRSRFEAVLRNVPAAVSLKDRQGTLHLANPAYERLVGREGLSGMFETDLFPEETADRLAERDAALFAQGAPMTGEERVVTPAGEARTLLTSRFLIDDPVLAQPVAAAIATDVTAFKVLQAGLEAARAEAEAAKDEKAQFLATMSHEIRTPMNGVLGMVEALARTAVDAEQRRMLEVVRDSGAMMLRLVNDILDFSKVEHGGVTLERVPFSPAETARRAAASHAEAARAKGVALRLDLGAEAERPRLGDPLRVSQILHNLLSNAVKFTERGEVALAVDATGAGALRVVVSDTGIGMSETQCARVFDRYAQAESGTARRYGGTGLGLAIVKGLAEAMDGAARVESAPGVGSVFTVVLPLPEAAEDAAAAAIRGGPAAPTGLRALAVDDQEVNRVVLAALLETLGVEAVIAATPREALEAAREGAFDVYLFDLMMPGMDGAELLAAIRAERGGTAPAAIAVTGHAGEAEIAASRDAGFACHLAKPVSVEALAAALARCAGAGA